MSRALPLHTAPWLLPKILTVAHLVHSASEITVEFWDVLTLRRFAGAIE
jgi:hypothetical protein